jgi:hypothetical protein
MSFSSFGQGVRSGADSRLRRLADAIAVRAHQLRAVQLQALDGVRERVCGRYASTLLICCAYEIAEFVPAMTMLSSPPGNGVLFDTQMLEAGALPTYPLIDAAARRSRRRG